MVCSFAGLVRAGCAGVMTGLYGRTATAQRAISTLRAHSVRPDLHFLLRALPAVESHDQTMHHDQAISGGGAGGAQLVGGGEHVSRRWRGGRFCSPQSRAHPIPGWRSE